MSYQSTTSTICQQLNSLFETFQSTYEESNIRFNLDQYIKDPRSDILSQLNKSFSDISSKKQELITKYQEQAKHILSKWFPNQNDEEALKDFTDSISFDESDQRVIINGNLNLRGSNISYFPELIKTISGDVDLVDTQLTSLNSLEEVGGELDLGGVSSLTSMSRLRKVGEHAWLSNTQLTSLNSLEEVGGGLYLRGVSSLTSMNSLRKVGGHAWLHNTQLISLDALEEVGRRLDLRGVSSLTSMSRLRKVGRHAVLSNTKLTSLNSLEEVGGELDLGGVSSLTSMSRLRKVGEHAWLSNTQLTSLNSLEEVGGELYLDGVSSLTSMSRLRKVGENISLFRISIDNFSNVFPILQEVGDFDNISFNVSSNKLKEQIEKLKEQRILKYSGEVKVISA